MYCGKYLAQKEKKKTAVSYLKRKVALIISLIIILGGAIGGTVAYFTDNTVSNRVFSIGEVSCSVSRLGDTYIVTNDGTVPACVRVAVVVNWEDQSEVLHWTKPNAVISFDNDAWTEKDGYYYYNSVIAANSSVNGPVVTISEAAPNGYFPKIQVLVEAVQENSDAWEFAHSGN